MQDSSFLQVRINPKDKDEAKLILDELGISLSSYVKMSIKQLINQKAIPFTPGKFDTIEHIASKTGDNQ